MGYLMFYKGFVSANPTFIFHVLFSPKADQSSTSIGKSFFHLLDRSRDGGE